MRLWGGESDTGCCSVSDVDDARRVAQQLDIDHLVFNFTDDFDDAVVQPYVDAHAVGRDAEPVHRVQPAGQVRPPRRAGRAARLRRRGHRPPRPRRRARRPAGRWSAAPIGPRTRATSCTCSARPSWPARCSRSAGSPTRRSCGRCASSLGLRTATKPDSQDVCFITSTGGRHDFLRRRLDLHPARVVDTAGTPVGEVAAVELVTVGQRRGLGLPGGGPTRFVVSVDRASSTVVVGPSPALLDASVAVADVTWTTAPSTVTCSCSAAPTVCPAGDAGPDGDGRAVVRWQQPERRGAR